MVIKRAASYARLKAARARSNAKYMKEKFKEHASTAILAALGFFIALVWRDFIVKLVKETVQIDALAKYPYLPELYTAIVITIIAIIAIAMISRWASKPEVK